MESHQCFVFPCTSIYNTCSGQCRKHSVWASAFERSACSSAYSLIVFIEYHFLLAFFFFFFFFLCVRDLFNSLNLLTFVVHNWSKLWIEMRNVATVSPCKICPVSKGWGCKIHRLLLFRGVIPHPMSAQYMTLNNLMGSAPKMLEFWGIRSTPSLPSFPGLLWPGMVALDRALSMC